MAGTSTASAPASELTLNGFRAFVECKNAQGIWNKAEVYKVETPHDKKITCYIASEEGLQYRISNSIDQSLGLDFTCHYFADGMKLQTNLANARLPCHALRTCMGKRSGIDTLLPVTFAKLRLTDDDITACQNEKIVKNLGLIHVKLLRVHIGGLGIQKPLEKQQSDPHVFHEQNKKAQLGHQTEFGQAIKMRPRQFYKTTRLDSDEDPYLHFEFRYRSRQLLEAQGIIPAALPTHAPAPEQYDQVPPSPPPPPRQRPANKGTVIDIDDSDDESEVDKLRREVAELRKAVKDGSAQAKVQVKAEMDVKPDIKRKAGSSSGLDDINASSSSCNSGSTALHKKQKIKVEPGELIDLTSD